jgi:hypothetical protein
LKGTEERHGRTIEQSPPPLDTGTLLLHATTHDMDTNEDAKQAATSVAASPSSATPAAAVLVQVLLMKDNEQLLLAQQQQLLLSHEEELSVSPKTAAGKCHNKKVADDEELQRQGKAKKMTADSHHSTHAVIIADEKFKKSRRTRSQRCKNQHNRILFCLDVTCAWTSHERTQSHQRSSLQPKKQSKASLQHKNWHKKTMKMMKTMVDVVMVDVAMANVDVAMLVDAAGQDHRRKTSLNPINVQDMADGQVDDAVHTNV